MLIQQVVMNSLFHDRRISGPLGVRTPELLEQFQLFILAGKLEILVYSLPGAIQRTNDPTV